MITTAGEHLSVIQSLAFAQKSGVEVVTLPIDANGQPDLDLYRAALSPQVRLISLQQVNQETGACLPVAQMALMARELAPRAHIHCDGVQAFLRAPVPSGLDFYTISAHKIGGPKGVGALVIPPNAVLPGVRPGGGQEFSLRGGTENTAGIFSFLAAAQAWLDKNQGLSLENLRLCKNAFWKSIQALDGLQINGPNPLDEQLSAPHILSVGVAGVRGEVLLHTLESQQIYIGLGSACSAKSLSGSAVLAAMGIPIWAREGAVRISFGWSSTPEEAAEAGEEFVKAVRHLRG